MPKLPKLGLGTDRQFRLLRLAVGVLVTLLMLAIITVMLFRAGNPVNEQVRKVGFIIPGEISDPGWYSLQYQGIKKACESFGVQLLVQQNVKEGTGQSRKALRSLARAGAQFIYLGHHSYPAEVRDLVLQMPRLSFASSTALGQTRNLTSYFVRLYQARYLAGALAALRSQSGVLGYVAGEESSAVYIGINAFTLGAQRINPDIQVKVAWTGDWDNTVREQELTRRLVEENGADVVTYNQNEHWVAVAAEELGVDYISYQEVLPFDSKHNLGAVMCRWELYYKDVVQRFLKGEVNAIKHRWLGIEDGVVWLEIVSPSVSAHQRQILGRMQLEILNQNFIFSGDIIDNKGVRHCSKNQTISDDALLERTDYLVAGASVID